MNQSDYEQPTPGTFTRSITNPTINPAFYEIQIDRLGPAAACTYELRCYRVTDDGARTELDYPAKTSGSFLALDRIGEIRIESTEEMRKAKHSRQTSNRTIKTNKGRTRIIGEGWKA